MSAADTAEDYLQSALGAAAPGGDAASFLAEQAERCRRLARATHDRKAAQTLEEMALDYTRAASGLSGNA